MKSLHHNETNMEHRGTGRLAGLPQPAAEVPEGYFSGWEVLPEKFGI